MNININRLRELTDKELLDYFKKENIYKSDAVLLAVKILETERNYLFSDLEKQKIEKVINDKKEKEQLDYFNRNNHLLDTPENKHFPKIESEWNFIHLSSLFSIFVGGYVIYKNLEILNLNTKKNVQKLCIYILFSFVILISVLVLYSIYMHDFVFEYFKKNIRIRRFRSKAFALYFFVYYITNFILALFIWSTFIKKGLKYPVHEKDF